MTSEELAYEMIIAAASKDSRTIVRALDNIPEDQFSEVCIELASAVVKIFVAQDATVESIRADLSKLMNQGLVE